MAITYTVIIAIGIHSKQPGVCYSVLTISDILCRYLWLIIHYLDLWTNFFIIIDSMIIFRCCQLGLRYINIEIGWNLDCKLYYCVITITQFFMQVDTGQTTHNQLRCQSLYITNMATEQTLWTIVCGEAVWILLC